MHAEIRRAIARERITAGAGYGFMALIRPESLPRTCSDTYRGALPDLTPTEAALEHRKDTIRRMTAVEQDTAALAALRRGHPHRDYSGRPRSHHQQRASQMPSATRIGGTR